MRTVRTYDDLAEEIFAAPARLGDARLVTVDGPSGSGKTDFAARLAAALAPRGSVALVEIEALYEGWTLEGSWTRLDEYVLQPLAAGWAGGFHPYDWATESWSPRWHPVPMSQVLVVEGCGSSPQAADGFTTHQIWVQAPAEVAFARGSTRKGVDLDRRLRAWKEVEAAYFTEQRTRGRADLRVDGNPAEPLPYDPDLAFTVLT